MTVGRGSLVKGNAAKDFHESNRGEVELASASRPVGVQGEPADGLPARPEMSGAYSLQQMLDGIKTKTARRRLHCGPFG
jgi:hypothetical protein